MTSKIKYTSKKCELIKEKKYEKLIINDQENAKGQGF